MSLSFKWSFDDKEVQKIANNLIKSSPDLFIGKSLNGDSLLDLSSSLVKSSIMSVTIPARVLSWLKEKIEENHETHEKIGGIVTITNDALDTLANLGIPYERLIQSKTGASESKVIGKNIDDAPYLFIKEVSPDKYSGYINVGDWSPKYSVTFSEKSLRSVALMLLAFIGAFPFVSDNIIKSELNNFSSEVLIKASREISKYTEKNNISPVYFYKQENTKKINKIPDFLVPFINEKKISETIKKSASAIFHTKNSTATTYEDIVFPLQVVPRAIISWVHTMVHGMKPGDIKHIEVPLRPVINDKFAETTPIEEQSTEDIENREIFVIRISKVGPDSYSGDILRNSEILLQFKHSPIPAIALFIMSSLELYSSFIDNTDSPTKIIRAFNTTPDPSAISEGIKQGLKEMEEEKEDEDEEEDEDYDTEEEDYSIETGMEDYIEDLVNEKLSTYFRNMSMPYYPPHPSMFYGHMPHQMMHTKMMLTPTMKSESKLNKETSVDKLKKFISKNNPYSVSFTGKSDIKCDYCGETVFNKSEESITLCLCHGELSGKKLKTIKKSDGNYFARLPKKIDNDGFMIVLKAFGQENKDGQ